MKLGSIDLEEEKYRKAQSCRTELATSTRYAPGDIISSEQYHALIDRLADVNKNNLVNRIRESKNLSFEDAFLAGCYVVSATNPEVRSRLQKTIEKSFANGRTFEAQSAHIIGTQLLETIAAKETARGLTPAEIAGLTASSLTDLVYRIPARHGALDTCGMGGDRGLEKGCKTINVSTLSGIVLASLGIPVIKHGSYKNTSAVGSTEAIEALGAKIHHASEEQINELLEKTNFFYADAHVFKTIHDLSHALFGETINHVIGPMTTPVTSDTMLYRVIGVNQNVHPRTIAKAYELLNARGFQKVANVCAVAGLDQQFADISDIDNFAETKEHVILDEVSPYASIISVVQNGNYAGTFLVTPDDFNIKLDDKKIRIPNNERELKYHNEAALQGRDEENCNFLALNAALGHFTYHHLSKPDAIKNGRLNKEYLMDSFYKCRQQLAFHRAYAHLQDYVKLSHSVTQEMPK